MPQPTPFGKRLRQARDLRGLSQSELAEKASKLGIPTDRVPVIDVRGRLLLGFDRARIEALLGEST